MKIEHVEPQLAQKLDNPLKHILQELQYLVPDNYRSRVSLLDATGRKKRSSASADNWSPESGRIEIRFEPTRPGQKQAGAAATSDKPESMPAVTAKAEKPRDNTPHTTINVHPPDADLLNILVKALDRAESKPGWNFVSLKKFRDEVLPCEPFAPGAFQPADVHWQNVLHLAKEKRLILLGRVPNPKAPEFPVTTVRLNRLMPEIRAILGGGNDSDLDFRPVEIKGEPLSATVIRERHR